MARRPITTPAFGTRRAATTQGTATQQAVSAGMPEIARTVARVAAPAVLGAALAPVVVPAAKAATTGIAASKAATAATGAAGALLNRAAPAVNRAAAPVVTAAQRAIAPIVAAAQRAASTPAATAINKAALPIVAAAQKTGGAVIAPAAVPYLFATAQQRATTTTPQGAPFPYGSGDAHTPQPPMAAPAPNTPPAVTRTPTTTAHTTPTATTGSTLTISGAPNLESGWPITYSGGVTVDPRFTSGVHSGGLGQFDPGDGMGTTFVPTVTTGVTTGTGTGVTTDTGTGVAGIDQSLRPDFGAQQNALFAEVDSAAQANIGMAAMFMNSMMSAVDNMERNIMEMFRRQGSELDPATLSALRSIREEVGRRRQAMNEEMNRRGVLQSGIWIDQENRLFQGQLTAEENVLAQRLSDIQNRMTDAMMDFANRRMNIMGTAYGHKMDATARHGQQRVGALGDMQGREMAWNQWWSEQAARRRNEAREQQNWQAEFGFRQTEAQRDQQNWQQQFGRQQERDRISDAQWEREQAWRQAEANRHQGQWTEEMRRQRERDRVNDQQWNSELELRRQAQQGQTINVTTPQGTQAIDPTTAELMSRITRYPSLAEALAAFNRERGRFEQAGVNIGVLLGAIYSHFGVTTNQP